MNRQLLNLAIRNMKATPTRHLVMMTAIILTTFLFGTIFSISSATFETYKHMTMTMAGGEGNLAIRYIDDNAFDAIKKHPLIDQISYARLISEDVNVEGISKEKPMVFYMDQEALDMSLLALKSGSWPNAVDQIAIDSTLADALLKQNGASNALSLQMTVGSVTVKKTYQISGVWQSNATDTIRRIFISEGTYKGLIDAGIVDLHQPMVVSNIKTSSTLAQEAQLDKIITESGYDRVAIDGVVKWSNLGSELLRNPKIVIGFLSLLGLVMLTSFLFINNIYQISLRHHVRTYSLFKCIGMTDKQLSAFISYQTWLLLLIAYPIGVGASVLVSHQIMPLLLAQTTYGVTIYRPQNTPLMLILTFLLVSITLVMSNRGPKRILRQVAPINASKWTGNYDNRLTLKSGWRGIWTLALKNTIHQKRAFVKVLLSLTLCAVLLASVSILSKSFDLDKYLEKFISSDVILGSEDYFSYQYDSSADFIDENLLDQIANLSGFKALDRVYYDTQSMVTLNQAAVPESPIGPDNQPLAQVFGIESLVLVDSQTLGKSVEKNSAIQDGGIVIGLKVDERGRLESESPYHLGEIIRLKGIRYTLSGEMTTTEKDYQVVGFTLVNQSNHSRSYFTSDIFYLNPKDYSILNGSSPIMSVSLTVDESLQDSFENQLGQLLLNQDSITYESRGTLKAQFEEARVLVLVVGGVLIFVSGIVGLLNYFNVALTSLLNRIYELTILSAIGLSASQRRGLFLMEGAIFVSLTAISSGFAILITAQFILRPMINAIWFMSYTAYGITYVYALLLLGGVVLSLALWMNWYLSRKTVSEQLSLTH